MIDYEIQQKLIKDIEWLTKTKAGVMERVERQEKFKQQAAERDE